MGNCVKTQKKSVAEINPFSPAEVNSFFPSQSPQVFNKGSPVRKPVVKLYGPPNDAATFYIRFALLYKPVSLTFNYSEIVESPVLYYDSDVISGSVETMLRYLDSKFPNPRLLPNNGSFGWYDGTTPLMVWLLTLQHRSMTWHLERMARWAEDLALRGGKSRGDPVMGSPRMEMKKFGRSYSQLMDMLLEHARMEERVVFPILEKADRGLCKAAQEEHAKDLPMLNGIKEDIKSIGVLDTGSPVYQEALSNLSDRLKILKKQCKEHFEEEERDLLPYMEAAELSKVQQGKVLEQCLDAMRETHTHLFRYFMEGLLPQDGIQYLDMIIKCSENNRATLMLHMIVE